MAKQKLFITRLFQFGGDGRELEKGAVVELDEPQAQAVIDAGCGREASPDEIKAAAKPAAPSEGEGEGAGKKPAASAEKKKKK